MMKIAPTFAAAHTLLHLVRQGHLDAAIEAGLMEWSAQAGDGLHDHEQALLMETCARLQTAWAARERFHARQARLERREQERQQRRAASPVSAASSSPPALPAAAAAILARARARVTPH